MPRKRHIFLKIFFLLLIVITIIGTIAVMYLEQQLPDVSKLKTIQLQVPMRIFTNDGKLFAKFGEKRRIPVEIKDVPPLLINALIATEDHRFYEHSGVDIIGLARAAIKLYVTGKKDQGGSTITMQVARNFFLTRKKTYTRKIREILLALKISRELSKQKVLELYLNKVYLGKRAYGIAAAAQTYYGVPLDELTLAQMAMLAGLPQAPSALNPISHPFAAKRRRTIVLGNMLEQHHINQQQFDEANNAPIAASYHYLNVSLKAPYVAEEIRDKLVRQYGSKAYSMGLTVYTTIDSHLQHAANQAVRHAILAYSQRHGFRKPQQNWGTPPDDLRAWQERLYKITTINSLIPAIVLTVEAQQITVLLTGGETIILPWQGLSWARPQLANGSVGKMPEQAKQIVKIGDVIRVLKTTDDAWQLSQIPEVEGALVSLNPHNGAVLAMVGGFDFTRSKFNRVEQAERQPGSGFKPFIYSAALNKGLTLATLINDAPIVTKMADQVELWRPQNDTKKFYGPTRLRVGLTKSRNLVSIRLLQEIGIPYTIDYVKRFGFSGKNTPPNLSLALGAGDVTPLQLATGYAIFANGGYRVKYHLINKVINEKNEVLFQAHPEQACVKNCFTDNTIKQEAKDKTTQTITNENPLAPRVITAQNAYLMTSALHSVIQQGTGRGVRVLNRSDLAGKTGTTNDQHDAWFSGFNSDIVAVVWVGFDQPRSLYEYGAQAALPMWIDFMRIALNDKPTHTMPRPLGLTTIRINKKTGLPTKSDSDNTLFEVFRQQYAPKARHNPKQNSQPSDKQDTSVYHNLY
ncbi:MAG: penicillin-binding protein 1A [Gammaproteobacteria bacterium]|nr:penicillin-binding protein 1A [Gammaproteobacteria bacterium]